jgi:hypothetical protein
MITAEVGLAPAVVYQFARAVLQQLATGANAALFGSVADAGLIKQRRLQYECYWTSEFLRLRLINFVQ